MNTKRNFPWWGVVLGVGCVGLLCIGIVVGGGFAYFIVQNSSTQSSPEVVITVPPPSIEQPGSTDAPVFPEPTTSVDPEPPSSGSSLTGNQRLDESYLFDDFSSDALGWPVADDGKIVLKYEDEQYSFQVTEPDYFDWAYPPVDFSPTYISFDVKSDVGPQDGTFGVFCQYQDEDNYFYVEFDLGEASYMIGQYVDGEDIVLTPQNAQGQNWQEVSTLYSAPGALNRIAVSCNRNFIALFINDEWITDVNPAKPVEDPGEMAFFVYALSSADSDGFKVYFDNVEVYKPVQ